MEKTVNSGCFSDTKESEMLFTPKPSAREGFGVNGGVVNRNGIKHTKE